MLVGLPSSSQALQRLKSFQMPPAIGTFDAVKTSSIHTQTLDGLPSCPRLPLVSHLFCVSPAGAPAGRAFLCVGTERRTRQVVEAADYAEDKTMKASRLALGLALASVTSVTSANASEQAASAVVQPAAKAEQGGDCSKETWPNFSAPCLRNANPTVEVRLVTGTRR